MKIVLYVIGSLFVVATLLPLIKHDHWAVRGFDFPHVQITIVNLLLFLSLVIFFPVQGWFNILFILTQIGCLIYQAFIIYPYTPAAGSQVKQTQQHIGDNAIGLMVTNVLMYNRNIEECLERIRSVDPDVLLMVETDEWWKTKMAPIRQKYNHYLEYPLENTYGMLLYAKFKLEDFDIRFLVKPDIPSFHGKVILPSGQPINLHCLHPEPPSPTESETSTERDAELLILGRNIIKADEPTLVAGDLNDVAWSYSTRLFIRISGLLDPRMGRGFYSTFHAKYPLMRWPLDHVFISNHFKLVELKRLPSYGSDHLPIYIRVNYEATAQYEQEKSKTDQLGRELAKEKIEKIRS
ncbi:endonuclease/exonuclease/phosphatase family protein [Tunicatimonas pelagia]|uniref:endonuclease/exonuclease/phosphatase family protein n=1 Tax=Tunicatimonas pelagia TaxID=931531 RepID=UPI002664EE49|nr:endonuclease/exonuclease/phosphatase family protein [Tunicatimonas pelagia]WKN45852.1 endonuclease/exonuclease/phosphatase family protein [Tunicatimonas pelagia]